MDSLTRSFVCSGFEQAPLQPTIELIQTFYAVITPEDEVCYDVRGNTAEEAAFKFLLRAGRRPAAFGSLGAIRAEGYDVLRLELRGQRA